MKSQIMIRTALPLLIGLGLIASMVWLLGAMPVKGAPSLSSMEVSGGVSEPQSPVQIQAVITIPAGTAATIDGYCREYGADSVTGTIIYNGVVTGEVFLKHDSANLYVCMRGLGGVREDRFASVYLDTDNGREGFAEADDYALHVGIITPTLESLHGTGVANGYIPLSLSGWTANTKYGNFDEAEFAIPLNLTGGYCGNHFGLAVYHHWLQFVGDDYGWPSNHWYDQPQTWQEVVLQSAPCSRGNIAYVYKRDTATAGDFKSLLESHGYTVTLIPMSAITTTPFGGFQLIIIADDTGNLDQWGDSSQVTPIISAQKPILGLGEGGYAFFGKLGSPLGWPNGWHGPQQQVLAANSSLLYYHAPYDFSGVLPGPFPLYAQFVNEVGIYLGNKPPVMEIGLEPAAQDHAPLINDDLPTGALGCYQLWGYSGGPRTMVLNGKRLFVNAVVDGLGHQCPIQPQPQNCVTLTKTAIPPSGTPVTPGMPIQYTIAYTVANNLQCSTPYAVLRDKIPMDTNFVPGSAGPGIVPNFDNTLVWILSLSPGDTGTRSFKVTVDDKQCHNQRRVNNIAYLSSSLGVFASNLVSHPVNCPPVTFPNPDKPPYAEDDIQIYPYPLVTGQPTHVSARVQNLSPQTQTVTVTFQFSSVDVFGIGLNLTALPVPGNPKVVTLPPSSTVQVNLNWIPVRSGHYCIAVKVEGAGFAPIYTYRNLDVTEDLKPGITDVLPFKVANPTVTTATIQLVVINTCPGWSAWITPTATLVNVGPNGTDIRDAYLNVTPPVGPPLGTACHIDVQGWIGDQLIGGIRKLDVPPVNLPHAEPPWMEKEITVNPDPPGVGVPISYCIELQNPLPFSRTVTVIYSYADFGAGIGFTPIQTRTITLPPSSIDKYCITWTPPTTGTLHKCLLITLKQPGFQDQRSQRNVNFRRLPVLVPGVPITFTIGNPSPFTRTLRLDVHLIGIGPLWQPHIQPDPPPELGPGQMLNFMLDLMPGTPSMEANATAAAGDDRFGDYSGTEVGVYLDDELVGGFTVDDTPIKVFLPVVMKQ